ncbi:hypothetical protein CJO79_13195 [Ralstonia solanacearum]|nr:hypothetical protein CJO79_13195 [Ralstonia solanacearum]
MTPGRSVMFDDSPDRREYESTSPTGPTYASLKHGRKVNEVAEGMLRRGGSTVSEEIRGLYRSGRFAFDKKGSTGKSILSAHSQLVEDGFHPRKIQDERIQRSIVARLNIKPTDEIYEDSDENKSDSDYGGSE